VGLRQNCGNCGGFVAVLWRFEAAIVRICAANYDKFAVELWQIAAKIAATLRQQSKIIRHFC
jgi:hypothetical protein